jgi:hypothetical protein
VYNICNKASRQLNVLKRIGTHLTKLGKLTIYYSFIMSNFNYLLDTFVEKPIPQKIEKIQERALRFIYNEYTSSYEDLLCKSKLPSLKVRKLRTFGLEVFKIVNKDCPVYLFDLRYKKYFVFFLCMSVLMLGLLFTCMSVLKALQSLCCMFLYSDFK